MKFEVDLNVIRRESYTVEVEAEEQEAAMDAAEKIALNDELDPAEMTHSSIDDVEIEFVAPIG